MRLASFPIEVLRRAGNFFDWLSEEWNMQWSLDELLAIAQFSMSEEGSKVDESPTGWDESTMRKALQAGGLATLDDVLLVLTAQGHEIKVEGDLIRFSRVENGLELAREGTLREVCGWLKVEGAEDIGLLADGLRSDFGEDLEEERA